MHIRAIDFSVLYFWNIAFTYNIKYEMFEGIPTVNDFVVDYNSAYQFFISFKITLNEYFGRICCIQIWSYFP